jgi:hypothetical protein
MAKALVEKLKKLVISESSLRARYGSAFISLFTMISINCDVLFRPIDTIVQQMNFG